MEQNPAQPVSYAPAQSQGYSTFEPPAPAQAPSAQPIPAPVATPAVGPYGQPPAASTPTPFAQPSPQPTQYPPQHPSQPAYGMPAYPSPMATSAQPPQAAAAPAPAPVPTPGAYQYPGYPAKETRAPSAHETPYGASVHTSAHPSMQAQPGVHAPQQMYAMNGYGVQPPANPHMLEKLMALVWRSVMFLHFLFYSRTRTKTWRESWERVLNTYRRSTRRWRGRLETLHKMCVCVLM